MLPAIRKTLPFAVSTGLFVIMLLVVMAACSLIPTNKTGQVEVRVATAFHTLTPTRTPTRTPIPTPTSTPKLVPVLDPSPTPEATDEIVCPSGDCAYTCLSKLRSFLNSSTQPLYPPASTRLHPSRSLDMTKLVTYQVEGDRITSPVLATDLAANLVPYQAQSAIQQNIWDYFAKIIPPDRRKDIKTFIIATDGVGGVLASLGISSGDLTNWHLSVDIVDAVDPTNMTLTLIHEFGHLLTLNRSQISPDAQLLANPDDPQVYATESAACPQYLAFDGCSLPDSTINLFFQKFWGQLYQPWTAIHAERDPVTYNRLLIDFYHAHLDQFITPYSATSPDEDVAESWTQFIFGKKPAGRNIADQKVQFFYGSPDLVQLRSQIVNAICLYSAGK